ncbi:hypothetical protein [Niabella aurantiaca]|uniref:hypothetical protein n=1 Tax=Niabella aurantiaca TaxID=379900 RepID=UPI0003A2E57B|nr:hypothetical protein [Niabella aurantiaca]
MVQAIKTGGYPEAVLRTIEARRDRWFESYLTGVLEKNIRDLSNIKGQLPNILHLIATRAGSAINFSDIARLAASKHHFSTLYGFIRTRIPAGKALCLDA